MVSNFSFDIRIFQVSVLKLVGHGFCLPHMFFF